MATRKKNPNFNSAEFFKNFETEFQEYFGNLETKYEEIFKRRKEIEQSTDYIDSLLEFLNNHSGRIHSDMFLYEKNVDEKSQNIVDRLNIFFDIIDDYASKCKIKKYDTEFGYDYYVSYNNIIMIVGIANGQGTIVYANIVTELENGVEVISYKDVISNVVPLYCVERVEVCKNFTTQLDAFFEALINAGMSKEQGIEFLKEYLKNLNTVE